MISPRNQGFCTSGTINTLEKWPEIDALFSREAVLNGSLDKYVGSLPQKRGDKRVDAALLDDISEWREMLAKNIALRNPDAGYYEPQLCSSGHHRSNNFPANL